MYFPIFLDINESKFLIIGAGNVALAKLETILEFTDNVRIVSEEISEQTAELVKKRNIEFIQDSYDEKYIKNADIIIAATDDKELNFRISNDVKKAKKLINAVDDPKNSQFIFGASSKIGKIILSVSTSGVSPVLARLLKKKLNSALPNNLVGLSDFLAKNKEIVKDKLTDLQARRLFWQEVIEGNIASEIEVGNSHKAQELLEEKLGNYKNHKESAVYFISAGPGDPELITLKAINLLSKADVVLYDRLVSPEILNYARKDALKINVGKTCSNHSYSQDEINELIRKYALEKNIVARLKGGDASIFARLSEEIDAIKDLEVTYQIVPGITAASAAAAYSGIPLTSRDSNKSTKFLTIYKKDLVNDDYWKDLAKTNDSLALYMSAQNLGEITRNLIKFGKNPQTPLAIIEQASTPFQKTFVTSLEEFKNDFEGKKFTSPSMTIIGDVVKHHHHFQWREETLDGTYFNKTEERNDN